MILTDMRAKGQTMVPLCTYVQSYLERFPEYGDLVVEHAR
jgi:predicted GNAT family acetyltransferase